ncbi:chromobox homolog 7a isoform X2 [Enoplosus armatus]|uniref:chromobox homolog 7a isoform X2 n=1 Tax=Enoplosus armatus TaxID=215367 RepID=UPI003992812F
MAGMVPKVQYLGTRGQYFGPAPGPGLRRANIFAMDLRSAHKEKPPPRLRLSLTRSMSTDVDQAVYRRPAWRKSKQRVSKRGPAHKTIRPLRKKEEPMEDWGGTSEEEKQESESTTEERREDSLYGQSECSSPPLLERQDLEMEVEEKVGADLTAVDTDTWTDTPGGTSETRQNQTFACNQSRDSASVPESGPGDAVTVGDGSDWDIGEESTESELECPGLESSVCQSNNTTSVIGSVQGSSETAGDHAAMVCSPAEASKEEVKGDNQSVTTATPGSQTAPAAADHLGNVIVTNVTINSLTVTFKEAMEAEGFFKGY